MATNSEKIAGPRALLRFLQRNGHVSGADATRLEQQAADGPASIQEILEQQSIISEKDLALLLAGNLRLPLVDLTSMALDSSVSRVLKDSIATKYEVVPVRLDQGTIEVAIANPLDLEALKAVEFATGRRAHAAVATRAEIRDALAHIYRLEESLEQFLQNVPGNEKLTVQELRDENADLRTVAKDAELPPVVKLADLILIEGCKSRASDVHVEPTPDAVVIRYRIDGILDEGFRFPKWVQNALVARFKVMAKLDITERRVPQDGRIQIRYRDAIVDLRVSSLPTHMGEKITLRILDSNRGVRNLDDLGLSRAGLQRLRAASARPEGMILVTGPTGSGKTTTLYALVRELHSSSVNIVTIENPIEYQLTGINQVDVNEKQGLTFASVLRSCLRQDPDVIFVGEIRDRETAQIAFQASQTGHLVLSTLHTNDAASTITRLLDLGIEPHTIASSLSVVVAQRLVRRVCPACSAPYSPPDESRRLLRLDDFRREYRRGLGCQQCRQTGYSGRVGVYEVVSLTAAISKLLESGMGESVVRQQARADGSATLLEDALEKLSAGDTTAEEVLRVVQVSDNAGKRCPGCNEPVEETYAVCPQCSHVLRRSCGACDKPLSANWQACPYCGGGAVRHNAGEVVTAAPSVAAGSAESTPSRSYKALVVDDDPDLRRILRLTLEGAGLGLSVITAQDGEEALALADIERPDLVVLDLSMPGMDGFEVCRRLRADMRTTFVPILMLTANDGARDVTRGFQVGTDDYLVKPMRRDDLLARIRRMLERTYGKDACSDGSSAAAPGLADAESAA